MLDNATLLKAAQKMDRGALITIFDWYASDIYNYVFKLSNDPVVSDEIVGDVFSELLERCATGAESITDLRIFLYQVAYRRVMEHLSPRHGKNRMKANAQLCISITLSSVRSDEENKHLNKMLGASNSHLNDLERQVMILRFLEGFSLKETAVIVGKSVSSVRRNQDRALARLRKAVCPDPGSEGSNSYLPSNASRTEA